MNPTHPLIADDEARLHGSPPLLTMLLGGVGSVLHRLTHPAH